MREEPHYAIPTRFRVQAVAFGLGWVDVEGGAHPTQEAAVAFARELLASETGWIGNRRQVRVKDCLTAGAIVWEEKREGSNHWTEEEAIAAGDIDRRRCIHGRPQNVFCGKCES